MTLRKTGWTFCIKGVGGDGCNLRISDRTPTIMISHFEGLGKTKRGLHYFYDHSTQNGDKNGI